MRVWIYGKNQRQIQQIRNSLIQPGDVVIGTSICAENGEVFPHSGLTPALYSAIRAELDQLIISGQSLLGSGLQQKQMSELLQSYGVSVRSASNCEISSS